MPGLRAKLSTLWAMVRGDWVLERCATIYFDAAYAEYLSWQRPPDDGLKALTPGQKEKFEALVKKHLQATGAPPGKVTMEDAVLFDRLASLLLPLPFLRRKLTNVRVRYRQMASSEDYQHYLDARPPDPASGDEGDLRADLDDLLGRILAVYVVAPYREEVRTNAQYRALGIMAAVVAAMLVCLVGMETYVSWLAPDVEVFVPALVVALVVGATGGLFSVQQRLQAAPAEGDAIRNTMSLYNGLLSLNLSLAVGAVSAGLLFFLLLGSYLSGALFPSLDTVKKGDAVMGWRQFILASGPLDGVDFAKLIIWSFLAGFAERFVPDTLSRIVSRVQAEANRPPPPNPPAQDPAPAPPAAGPSSRNSSSQSSASQSSQRPEGSSSQISRSQSSASSAQGNRP